MFWIEFLDTDKQTLFLWWKDTRDQYDPKIYLNQDFYI